LKIGYFLSSGEWGPRDLVAQAVKAQEAGFEAYRERVLPRVR
jgi:hypothetical protein